MYPIRLGYAGAERRIKRLQKGGHHAEAMLTTVFTAEKTIRRALLVAAIGSGLTNKQAHSVVGMHGGLKRLKQLWPVFMPGEVTLPAMFGPAWSQLSAAATMRNKMVHGERVYSVEEYKTHTTSILEALPTFRATLSESIGHDGWSRLPIRRKSALTWGLPGKK